MTIRKIGFKVLNGILLLCILFSTINVLSKLQKEECSLTELDIPSVMSLEEAKAKGHVKRLREIEPDDFSVVFLNRDGTESLYYYDEPVKYKDLNGNILDKRLDIISSGESYLSDQNDVKTVFPNKIDSESHVQMIYNSTLLEFSHLNSNDLYSVAKLTKNNNNKDCVLYESIGNGINALLQPQLNGLKESLIINNYNGESIFSYNIKTNGLKLVNNGFTASIIEPKTNAIIYNISEMLVTDSSGNEEHYSIGKLNIDTIEENLEYRISIHIDETYLKNELTIYPVSINSLYVVNKSNTFDSSVYAGLPTSNGYAYTSPYNPVGLHTGDYGEAKALIGFNLDSLKSLHINNVIFASYDAYESSGKTNLMQIRYYAIDGSWNHTTINWNEAHALKKNLISSFYVVNNSITSLPLTNIVQHWINYVQTKDLIAYNNTSIGINPMNGIMIESTATGVSSKHFRSAQHTSDTGSYLYINYNSNPYVSSYVPWKFNENIAFLPYHRSYQFRMNCYGFALQTFYANDLGYSSDRPTFKFSDGVTRVVPVYRQQPGEFYSDSEVYPDLQYKITASLLPNGLTFTFEDGTKILGTGNGKTYIKNNFIKDLETLGIYYEETTALGYVPSNMRKITLAIGVLDTLNDNASIDYHFYSRIDSNTLVHKQGYASVSNKSIDSKILINDSNIDQCAREAYYNDVVYYFLIDKDALVASHPHNFGQFDWSVSTPMIHIN